MADKKTKKKGNELDEMSLDELIERCKQIKELLANLENQYRSAEITEQSYKQTKDANTKKLNEVKTRLEEWGVKDEDTPAPAAAPAVAAQKPAASTSAAPAAAPATATAAPTTASSSLSTAQKTASVPVPPPAQTPAFTSPTEVEEVTETPAIQAPASAPMSFTQKLKQQFIPSASRASEDPAYISQTVQLELQKFQEKFNVELERVKATMDAIKETRASGDERMQMLTEGLAELRSNVFQREAGIKEQEMKLTKLKEMVDDLEPQKISKEFSKRDKTSNDAELRIEKLEVKTGDLSKTINEINALLKSIGGLENVANLDHEASKKLEKIQEINKSIERLSLKTEKIFVDMNKRLEKFNIYEARQDNMSEVVNDMIRNFDALSIKFESYAEKKDLTTIKEDIADIQKKMEEFKKTLRKAVPFAEAQIPEELAAMQTEMEDIESLLSSIEYGHEKKQIKDDEYAAMKGKNEARLKEIKQKIAEAMKKIPSPSEESGADANAKKQAPSLVNAMLDDKKAIDAAAKKNAEEAKKKEDAAKQAAENALETNKSESNEETEDAEKGDEENDTDEESEEENGNDEEQESEDDAEDDEKEGALETKDAPNSKEPEPIAKKAAPAKEKSAGKKKEPALQKDDAKTAEAPPSGKTDKTIAPDLPAETGNSASEKLQPADASGKTVQKDAPKKPRKSLRASEGLFVPAKEIAGIKSAVSPAILSAEQFAEIAKGANENATAPADSVKPENKTENKKSDKINTRPEPVSALEQKEEKDEENPLFAELDESLKEGLISKETYENTKKLLMMG